MRTQNAKRPRICRLIVQGQPYVVWPAPGFPALLEAEQNEFSVIVAHENHASEEWTRWADHLALKAKSNRVTTPLNVTRIEPLGLGGLEPTAHGFAGHHFGCQHA